MTNETDMKTIGSMLEEISGSFSDYRQRLDRLETKLSRPGAMVEKANADVEYQVDGEPVRVLRSVNDIRSHYRQKAADAGGVSGLRISDFLKAVAGLSAPPEARAVLTTGTDADGGFLIPSLTMSRVLEALIPASSVMTAGAGILPLEAQGAKSFTMAAVETVPTAAWRAENAAVAESDPSFRAVVMVPRSLSFYFRSSREWLADAFGADAVLNTIIAQSFARELDRAALRGTGTAPQPRGILNTTNVLSVPNGTNGASLATTRYANFFSGVQQILENNGPMPTAAIMSPRSRVVLGGLLDTTNQPLQVPSMLSNLQMLTTSQVPNNLTVGTSTDCSEIYLGEFSRVVYAMREAVSIQPLREAFATSGQVAFLAHARVDIAVLYPRAFCVVSGVRP
jgi:HK97 family phage major capsid protein